MISEKLILDLIYLFLNVFFSYTNWDTQMHVETPVLFRIKIFVQQGVDEAMGITKGQVHPLALTKFISKSHIKPHIPFIHLFSSLLSR